ncbi:hypothetical protein LINPERPRIM_LOCUS34069, partial [Linum perenne]
LKRKKLLLLSSDFEKKSSRSIVHFVAKTSEAGRKESYLYRHHECLMTKRSLLLVKDMFTP